jgi:hypothetical protein
MVAGYRPRAIEQAAPQEATLITEIPSAADFCLAAGNMLNVAWEIAMESLDYWEDSAVLHPDEWPAMTYTAEDGSTVTLANDEASPTPEQVDRAKNTFWIRSQPSLGIGLVLIQQAVEFALKGRIADTSPFLLISGQGRDFPAVPKGDIPFSAFRSLDAADLMRVHDNVCGENLGKVYGEFWDALRRERNLRMHTVSTKNTVVTPFGLMSLILTANEILAYKMTWFQRRLRYINDSEINVAFLPTPQEEYTRALGELEKALYYLEPAKLKRTFGYDKKSRAYRCVWCRDRSDGDQYYERELGDTAQLRPKSKDSTLLHCVICERDTKVRREPCAKCKRTVICDEGEAQGECLSCGHDPARVET